MGRPGHDFQPLSPSAARFFRRCEANDPTPIFFDCGAEKSFRRTGGEASANGVPHLTFWRGIDLFGIFRNEQGSLKGDGGKFLQR
jgi:hypothetical protein